MVMSLQLVIAFAVTSLVGALMMAQGVSMNMLERRVLRCRVCGGIPRRTCTCKRD
jgi:hypothetical protein